MSGRRKARSRRKVAAEKEFESLLRRAAAYYRTRKTRRVSKVARKKHRAA
jgi:hypothetical protein